MVLTIPQNLFMGQSDCLSAGQLFQAALNEEEVKLYRTMDSKSMDYSHGFSDHHKGTDSKPPSRWCHSLKIIKNISRDDIGASSSILM